MGVCLGGTVDVLDVIEFGARFGFLNFEYEIQSVELYAIELFPPLLFFQSVQPQPLPHIESPLVDASKATSSLDSYALSQRFGQRGDNGIGHFRKSVAMSARHITVHR